MFKTFHVHDPLPQKATQQTLGIQNHVVATNKGPNIVIGDGRSHQPRSTAAGVWNGVGGQKSGDWGSAEDHEAYLAGGKEG